MNINQLKAIKVTHLDTENRKTVSYITHDQFKTSFVDERWSGERRTNKKYTIFGYYHTKTTVKLFDGAKSVRVFEFPDTQAEAEARHKEAVK